MKKFIILSAAILMSAMAAHAQIQKGNLMLGSDLGSGMVTPASDGLFGANFNLNKGSGWNIGISPKLGYFVANNLSIGGLVDLGYSKAAGASSGTTVWGIQAFGRYYIVPNQYGINNLLKHGRFFIEANVGFAGFNSPTNTTNGLAFGFGPAYSYFLTPNVALEGLVKYNGLTGSGNTSYQSSIGVNFGVQVFLPSSKVRAMIKNPSQL